MDANTSHIDPVQLIEQLDRDAIANQLDELDRQSKALRALLRAANARDKRKAREVQEHAQ